MANTKKAYFAVAVTSLVWGTTWVASKMGVSHVPAFQFASIRQFLGGIIYVSFFLINVMFFFMSVVFYVSCFIALVVHVSLFMQVFCHF